MTDRADNPFFILEVPVDAAPREVERQGAKVLSMLQVGFPGAESYATRGQTWPRDEGKVRWALGELADPVKRVVWELWATPPGDPPAEPSPAGGGGSPPLPEARTVRWWE